MGGASYGALVGWTGHDLGGRLMLRLDSVAPGDGTPPFDIRQHHLLMTKNQALILANYLLQQSGQTPPKQVRNTWWRRVLRAKMMLSWPV
jgi:hypothetical protein